MRRHADDAELAVFDGRVRSHIETEPKQTGESDRDSYLATPAGFGYQDLRAEKRVANSLEDRCCNKLGLRIMCVEGNSEIGVAIG